MGDFKTLERLYFDDKKYADAYALAAKLANSGDVKARRFLGWLHCKGKGCDINLEIAEACFSQAAADGDAEAVYGLASVAFHRKRFVNALEAYKAAAQKGFAPALFRIGLQYERGLGVPKDFEQAFRYFSQAKVRGNLYAERAIVRLLFAGFKGLSGRLQAPIYLVSVVIRGFVVALKDPHNRQLMY